MSKPTMLDEVGLQVMTEYCRKLSLEKAQELKNSLQTVIELHMESIAVLNVVIPELQAKEIKNKIEVK